MSVKIKLQNKNIEISEADQQNIDFIENFINDNSNQYGSNPTITVVQDNNTGDLGYIISHTKDYNTGYTIISPQFLESEIKNAVVEYNPGSVPGDGGRARPCGSQITYKTYMREIMSGDFSTIPENAILTMPPMSKYSTVSVSADLLEAMGGDLTNIGYTGFSDSGINALLNSGDAALDPRFDGVKIRAVENDPYNYETYCQMLHNGHYTPEELAKITERIEVYTLIPDDKSVASIVYGKNWGRYNYNDTDKTEVGMRTMYFTMGKLDEYGFKNYIVRIDSNLDHSGYYKLNTKAMNEADFLAGNDPFLKIKDGYDGISISSVEFFRKNNTGKSGFNSYYKFEPEIFEEVFGAENISEDERTMLFKLKSKYSFLEGEDTSKISVNYVESLGKIEELSNYIADKSKLDRFDINSIRGDKTNQTFNSLFNGEKPYIEKSTLLDFKVKESILAMSDHIKNVALTEAELKAVVESDFAKITNLVFGAGSNESLGAYINVLDRKSYVLGVSDDKLTIGTVKNVDLSQITAIMRSSMLSDIQDQVQIAKDSNAMITDMITNGGLYGSAFDKYKGDLELLSQCMQKRIASGELLHKTYKDCLTKMKNYMLSNSVTAIDDSNYSSLLSQRDQLKKDIALAEARAKIKDWRIVQVGTKLGIAIYAIEMYYPYAEESAAIIAELTPVLEETVHQIEIIEGWNRLLVECNEKILEAENQVNSTFIESVNGLPDLNLLTI